MTSVAALVFYGLMAVGAVAAATWADLNILIWHDDYQTSRAFDVTLGLGVGLVVVVVSALLERVAEWARRLSEAFTGLLGPLSWGQISVFALTSSIGEELLFRGFLQQWISANLLDGPYASAVGLIITSVVFGIIHIGPDRKTFLPWTIMAIAMGFVLGAMYMYTGNVLAPVLCHFTINFINLAQLSRRSITT